MTVAIELDFSHATENQAGDISGIKVAVENAGRRQTRIVTIGAAGIRPGLTTDHGLRVNVEALGAIPARVAKSAAGIIDPKILRMDISEGVRRNNVIEYTAKNSRKTILNAHFGEANLSIL